MQVISGRENGGSQTSPHKISNDLNITSKVLLIVIDSYSRNVVRPKLFEDCPAVFAVVESARVWRIEKHLSFHIRDIVSYDAKMIILYKFIFVIRELTKTECRLWNYCL